MLLFLVLLLKRSIPSKSIDATSHSGSNHRLPCPQLQAEYLVLHSKQKNRSCSCC